MTPERYQQITHLHQAALELTPSQREIFLAQACAGDDELRREVESLLAHDAQSDSFLAAPALNVAAQLLTPPQHAITGGQRIGHYQVLSLLGTGGMGEVYLAEDTRLHRKVALKLLPAAFTQDAERLRRFEREAQSASALNHPNILTIYDFGQSEIAGSRLHYLVMEFIEGVTLRQRLTSGRLPMPEALSIVKQIAAALDTAHEAGILHRDIKPENVMLRPDRLAKVLDFGLAKLIERKREGALERNSEDDPAIALSLLRSVPPSQTASGMVMGTPRYMSPEQARGLKVDARTDVFSLGVVFYEMVTGEPAFAGPSTAEVFAALLDQEPPPLRQFVDDVPDSLQEIISRMLVKERDQRYQSVRAVMEALAQLDLIAPSGSNAQATRRSEAACDKELVTGKPSPPETGAQPLWQARWRTVLALALVLASVLGFAGYRWLAGGKGVVKRPAGEPRFVPLVGQAGRKDHAAISPDETRIAFAWDGGRVEEVGPADIYVKVIGTDEPPLRMTTAPENDNFPSWTPDGKYVTFVRGRDGKGEVMRVPASGGPEQKLAETFTTASWSPDGKTLAVSGLPGSAEGQCILLVNPETGQRTRLTTPGPSITDHFPRFSPDGKLVAFRRDFGENQVDVCIVPASGGTPRQLTFEKNAISGLTWAGDSREIVFSAVRQGARGLWRISLQGGPIERVPVNSRDPLNPDISRQGDKLVFTEYANDSNLWLYQGAGFAGRKVPGKFGAPVKLRGNSLYDDQSPVFSPDGETIVFASERSGRQGLWMCDAEGKTAPRLLNRDGSAGSPRWSYDGKWIAYDSYDEGDGNIYVISAASDSRPRRLTPEKSSENLPAWSHDGQWIYFRSNRTGSNQIYKMPAAGGEARQITFNGGFEGFESPDGKRFYYSKDRGVRGIYSVPVNGGEETLVPELKEAGYWRSWALVNEGICFPVKKSDSEWAIQFFSFATRRTSSLVTVTDAPLFWMPGLALSADGRRLLYAHLENPYDEIMLMENFR